MEDKKLYKIEICRGPKGCRNSVVNVESLLRNIEKLCENLLEKISFGTINHHQLFKISISNCPNGCSRPQIAAIGIIAASMPYITNENCSGCGNCVLTCREGVVLLNQEMTKPIINYDKCLYCEACVRACPVEVIKSERRGYRILSGGKLGRHPGLGIDL